MTRQVLDMTRPLPLEVYADPWACAIALSLFCDARALPEDAQAIPRGWWGDKLAQQNDNWGSRLWLLASRAKKTPETLLRAEQYAREALSWMLADGVAQSLSVSAHGQGEALVLAITIDHVTFEVRYAH